ncbi:MAG: FG-GAP-like repeat-containing protein [Candidatus Eiseniibacteriota bacterium]
MPPGLRLSSTVPVVLWLLAGGLGSPAAAVWTFTDVSAASGAGVVHNVSGTGTQQQKMTSGVACGDFDNDGWIDLYHLGGNLGSNHLLRNNGDGTFTNVAAAAGVSLSGTWGAGATFADWNGDGWLDLFVGSIAPSKYYLFENDGDGTFTNVTDSTGVVFALDTMSASFGDIDNDGDLDMALTHWGEGQSPKHFWRNDGSDAFSTNFASADTLIGYLDFRGHPADNTFAYNFADLNSDGWMDFVCASDFVTSHVYMNDGDGTFTDVTNTSVINDDNGMGSCVADYDKDGDLDWFVSSIMNDVAMTKNGNRMYRNLGDGTFEDATDHANVRDGQWGWGATFQDFNNDGWLDIFHTNGWQIPQYDFDASVLYVSDGDATFTEMAAALGVADTDQGRGVACFDYDRDGDIDIFVANCDQPARLYRNDGGNAGNWLDVKLVGPSPNTEQIGARITAKIPGSSQLWEMRAGNNFESQDPAEAHFGLGTATDVDSLVIRWTDGSVTTLLDVPANQLLVLDQNAAADLAVDLDVSTAAPDEGQTIVYTVTVINAGPDAASGVTVTKLLPAGVTYVSDAPDQGSYVSGTGVWTVGTLASSAFATLDVTATVDPGTAGTTILATASRAASTPTDGNAANDSDSETITVRSADLAVTHVVDDPAPPENGTIVYTVTVTNVGPDGASGVVVTDLLPTGVTYLSDLASQGTYASGTGVWAVGALANSAFATLDVTATVDPGTSGTPILATASRTASSPMDTNGANDSASAGITVEAAADLAVTKTVDDPAPPEGGTITYTITVTNTGPAAASGVEVSDLLPAGITFQSSSSGYSGASGVWTVGALAATQSDTLTIAATVDIGTGGSTITNTCRLIALDQTDGNPGNDADSADVAVVTIVGAGQADFLPTEYALSGGQPNPFRGTTAIRFDLPAGGRVNLSLFDVTGRLVKTLVDRDLTPGRYEPGWDGRDDAGRTVSPGVYFVRLEAGPFVAARRTVRLD